MSGRREAAYRTMMRVARVNQLKARQALVSAQSHEFDCRERVSDVTRSIDAAIEASHRCRPAGSAMDMARYALVSEVIQGHEAQLLASQAALDAAEQARRQCDLVEKQLERRHDFLDERKTLIANQRCATHMERERDQALELWIERD